MSFKVIDGSGPSKEERNQQEKERELQQQRDGTRSDFSWALRDCAANMLRIIRGAGKPNELMRQMQKALNAAVKFREVPSSDHRSKVGVPSRTRSRCFSAHQGPGAMMRKVRRLAAPKPPFGLP